MKPGIKISAVILPIVLFALTAPAQSVPSLINYQGRLTDQTGAALASGTYQVTFSLYDSPTAGNLIWGTSYNVAVVGGQFNIVLGAGGGTTVGNAAVNNIGFAFGGSNRYLQLTVLSDNTGTNLLSTPQVIAPRQQILSTPYALNGNPAGSVIAFAGTNVPAGWLLCDGSSINAGTNSAFLGLLAAIGKTYGVGDGTALSFNVPDLRGRTSIGAGVGTNLTLRSVGQMLGSETSTLAASQVPPHSHPVNLTTANAGAHTHGVPYFNVPNLNVGNCFSVSAGTLSVGVSVYSTLNTMSSGSHTHSVIGNTDNSIGNGVGGTDPHNIMQPSIVLNYIIKY